MGDVATRDLTRFAWFSIVVALTTMGLKLVAWRFTGSVGLLSDAMESSVNLAAGILMLIALRVAALPPDDNHHFGHEKAELFSAAAEGLMIVVAASLIMWTAVDRLLHPRAVEQVGIGLAVSVVASLANLGAGLYLVHNGRIHSSGALSADGRHLLTDVYTSIGVLIGVGLVGITGWRPLDPIVAFAVGINIVVTGSRLLWSSVEALMDPPLPPEEHEAIQHVIDRYELSDIVFHALRSRVSGQRRFVSVHVLVPGRWTVAEGHVLLERFEADLRAAVPNLNVLTHLEPVEDPTSYLDEELDRTDTAASDGCGGAEVRPPGS